MSKIAPAINLDKAKGKHYVKDWWLGRPWVTEAGGGCPWAPSWPDVCGEIKMAPTRGCEMSVINLPCHPNCPQTITTTSTVKQTVFDPLATWCAKPLNQASYF